MLGTFNLWTYFYPISAFNVFESIEDLNLFNRLSGFIYAASVVILIVRIWKNRCDKNRERNMWIALTIISPIVFGSIYIWFKEDQFIDQNQ